MIEVLVLLAIVGAGALGILGTLRESRPMPLRADVVDAFERMDELDAREAVDAEYAAPMAVLSCPLPSWAAAMAIERAADRERPSRRRYVGVLRHADVREGRERLVEIARDVTDPLAGDVWSLLTGRPAGEWARALVASDGGESPSFLASSGPRSGEWRGLYAQFGGEHPMTLALNFRGGRVEGQGVDEVGGFTFSGTVEGRDVRMTKTYATHTVEYLGRLRGCCISGRWFIKGWDSGTFKLWPA